MTYPYRRERILHIGEVISKFYEVCWLVPHKLMKKSGPEKVLVLPFYTENIVAKSEMGQNNEQDQELEGTSNNQKKIMEQEQQRNEWRERRLRNEQEKLESLSRKTQPKKSE